MGYIEEGEDQGRRTRSAARPAPVASPPPAKKNRTEPSTSAAGAHRNPLMTDLSAAQPSFPFISTRRCFHCDRLNHYKKNCPFPKPKPEGVQWPPPSDLDPPKPDATQDEMDEWTREAKYHHPKLMGDYRRQLKNK